MQIVIDIDDNLYTRLFVNGVYNYDDALDMARAIRKCTHLPKGHGRLIDADEIQFENSEFATYGDYCIAFDAIDCAPTIIEKDGD